MQRARGPETVRIEAGREANDGQAEAMMRQKRPTDPEAAQLLRSPLPFPALRFSAGRESLSRLPFGAPKPGAVLTGTPSPQGKNLTEKGEWELGQSLVAFRQLRLPLVGDGRSSEVQQTEN